MEEGDFANRSFGAATSHSFVIPDLIRDPAFSRHHWFRHPAGPRIKSGVAGAIGRPTQGRPPSSPDPEILHRRSVGAAAFRVTALDHMRGALPVDRDQIGKASGRERVCTYV